MHAEESDPRWRDRLVPGGVPRTGVLVKTVDDRDREEPPAKSARSSPAATASWEASAETLRGGWLHTGDLGSFDEDGFLTLRDRSKHMIISGGSNIYPREIEEVLLRHPDLVEVSVVGRPHPEWARRSSPLSSRDPEPRSPPMHSTGCASTTSPASSARATIAL
jgi:long-chain acyl-CoA synthetase